LAHAWGRIRRRVLTPDLRETLLETRGFHRKSSAAQELLETVGRYFLTGYGYAAEAGSTLEAENNLETVPTRFRGFAYEGAAMACTMRDRLLFGGGRHLSGFLAGRGEAHVYMAYVGIGWAMARLPRFRWPRADTTDPLLRWLILDGYGFHQAYFHTEKYVRQQFQEPRFPWPAGGPSWYANRAIDQGIGRALWFVDGTDAELVASTVERFPAMRRADLYSGVGLAATYAGGADEDELRALWDRAGEYRPQLAQGSAFAADARIKADLLVPHVEEATRILCGAPPDEAAKTTLDLRPEGPVRGDLPAYEVWRQRIASEFVSLGRC
jgi:enediyne biosynthesis protein E3